MSLLPASVIDEIHRAAVRAGLAGAHATLLRGLGAELTASLSSAPSPAAQLLSDLHELNNVERLADGSMPLDGWLCNAISLSGHRREQAIFRSARRALEMGSGDSRATPTSGPFHVPFPRNHRFIGREEDLADLHRLLADGRPVGVRPTMVSGMGGIGKTQLGVEYAYRYRHEHPGGVYWVNAAEDWVSGMADLAEKCGLFTLNDAAPDRRVHLARAGTRPQPHADRSYRRGRARRGRDVARGEHRWPSVDCPAHAPTSIFSLAFSSFSDTFTPPLSRSRGTNTPPQEPQP